MSMITAISVLAISTQVNGHGNMFYPVPWPNQLGNGRTLPDFTEVPRRSYRNLLKFRGPLYPQPDEVCQGSGFGSGCSPNRVQGAAKDWFTNHTFIPGEPTIPDDMYSGASYAKIQALKRLKHPWTSPGTAPIFGEGCGANGGNPNGCQCKQTGPVNFCYGNEERPYGSCCAQSEYRCGGFTYGKSAMEHADDGLFDNAAVTRWERGQAAEVLWKTGAGHRGGYAYRLCKVPAAGISGVTEQCFQNGHLNFDGPYTWVTNTARRQSFVRETAVRTTDVNGNQWNKMNIQGSANPGNSDKVEWFWKDRVMVPQSLATGRYVLSFRWDCQNTPQVWNSCANIEIV